MLHQVRRRLHHAPCVAAQAHPASLAQIRYQKVLAALLTPRPRKAVRQNAAPKNLRKSRSTYPGTRSTTQFAPDKMLVDYINLM